MTYRELRNLSESLRALDFPRQVSIENFRKPNFKLVAELLVWLVKKYDADYDIPMVIDTEQDRVILIKTATLFLIQKARIKVNPKKLYQADGYAAQELLKVSSVLYSAVRTDNLLDENNRQNSASLASVTNTINAKIGDLRLSRQLAAEIPEKGAILFDLLSKEVHLREQRLSALARPLELNQVEKSIRSSIRAVEEETKQMLHNLSNVSSDEQTLDAKIEKKRADLDRQQKRLAQLQSHRPAYMDEYEKLENHLKSLYSLYVQKFRNVTYIEQLVNDYDKVEQERNMEAELSLRKLAERQRDDERDRLAAAADKINVLGLALDDESDHEVNKGPKVHGNITGAGLSDDDTADGDSALSDDDSDMQGNENAELIAKPKPKARPGHQASKDGASALNEPLTHDDQDEPSGGDSDDDF